MLITAPGGSTALAQQPSPAEKILASSDWTILIDGMQFGGIRIRQGIIYPGDTRLNNPVGEAGFNQAGALYLRFLNHPKISRGEAAVTKIADRTWAGPLYQLQLERRLVLKRNG